MDEKLLATIKKIKLLSEQNSEFRQEMQKLFGKTVSASVVKDDDRRISHIEKYLGLDYYVDSMESIIDYTFINEDVVRDKLISDNREMMRFRYGTRSHKVDFEEFCRYAQLQAEMLLNYFYSNTEDSIQNIISHIKQYNPKANISDNNTSLSSISFSVKLWAYDSEFKINIRESFDHVREVRNNQSHRTPQKEDFSIEAYQKKLLDWKISLKTDGTFDWFQTKQNNLAYNIYESRVKNTKDFALYNYLIWYNNKPYDDIVEKLKSLAASVKNNLGSSVVSKL
jgi:hypothetical protein